MSDGWIRLHRKLKDSPIFNNSELLKVWIWCLLKATHDEYVQMVGLQEVLLKKGQFIFGRKAASDELDINESKIYRLINKLQKMQNIIIKTNNKFSIITIVKWEYYQTDNIKNEQQMNNKRTTNEHKQEQKNNIYICIEGYSENLMLRQAFKDFLEMRTKIKEPMTEKAIKLLFNKLDKMANSNEQLKIELLNQSILNNWKSVYPLKEDDKQDPIKKKQPYKPKPNKFHNFIPSDVEEGDLEEMARKKFEKLIQGKKKEVE